MLAERHSTAYREMCLHASGQDQGKHWDAISPDLSRENPQIPSNLDPLTVEGNERAGPRRGVVYSIGPSLLDERLIWAGTDDSLLWRTRDGGKHSQNVTPPALGAWSKVRVVEPSHFDADGTYIAVDRSASMTRDPTSTALTTVARAEC